MKERVIDLQLIKPITPGSPSAKGKISLKKLFKEELTKLQVPFSDPCCPEEGGFCPPISEDEGNTIECRVDGLYSAGTDIGDFIQNQTAVDQVASFRISGTGTVGNTFTIIGSVAGLQSVIRLPAAQAVSTPYFQVQNSAGTPIMAFNNISVGNVLIGVDVGGSLTTGVGSVVIGNPGFFGTTYGANTTGSSNTVVGHGALVANTTGSGHTAIGNNCMVGNTTGSLNTAMGQAALAFNNTGTANVAIGVNAARGNGAGLATYSNIVAIGQAAFSNTSSGDNCIAIGKSALAGLSTVVPIGAGTIAIGASCAANRQIGANNILIGFQNCLDNSMVDNNIIIGANCTLDSIATISNTTLLGTTMSSAISNIVGIGRTDQNIIVGLTAITADNGAKLQVNGDITTTSPGSGVGKWKLGTVVTAASTLDTTKYVEISVDGVVVKVATMS